jgi:hypothetical protein
LFSTIVFNYYRQQERKLTKLKPNNRLQKQKIGYKKQKIGYKKQKKKKLMEVKGKSSQRFADLRRFKMAL